MAQYKIDWPRGFGCRVGGSGGTLEKDMQRAARTADSEPRSRRPNHSVVEREGGEAELRISVAVRARVGTRPLATFRKSRKPPPLGVKQVFHRPIAYDEMRTASATGRADDRPFVISGSVAGNQSGRLGGARRHGGADARRAIRKFSALLQHRSVHLTNVGARETIYNRTWTRC